MYREMLVEFMEGKQKLLDRLGIHYPRYFTGQDKKEMLGWDEEVAEMVFKRLEKEIDDGECNLTEYVCPFCLLVMDNEDFEDCGSCGYGMRHGLCREMNSEFSEIIRLLDMVKRASFTNDFYKSLLHKIKDRRGV